MVTEAEVQRHFRQLFRSGEAQSSTLEQAEQLLQSLHAESPLRHRLEEELAEIRTITGWAQARFPTNS